MQFGDAGGAVGYLVGQENEGLKYMFTMMNNARLCVGLQGVAIAEAAYQAANAYAQDRVQGTSLTDKSGHKVTIVHHPDVKRMLLSMAAQVEAGRALTYSAAANLDLARGGDAKAQARVDLLTPIVKAWCTDMAVRVTSIGVQVHGGMGFIEETGAAQFYRDSRILPIYEGTNGIQAADLVFRKILRDQGAALNEYLADAKDEIAMLSSMPGDDMDVLNKSLTAALEHVERASKHLFTLAKDGPDYAAAIATPYLEGIGTFAGGVVMARSARMAVSALHEGYGNVGFWDQKIIHARFYAEHILPMAQAALNSVLNGAKIVVSAQ
jgi:3-(methylthio)propanoyl-CoA dehydrogenase